MSGEVWPQALEDHRPWRGLLPVPQPAVAVDVAGAAVEHPMAVAAVEWGAGVLHRLRPLPLGGGGQLVGVGVGRVRLEVVAS